MSRDRERVRHPVRSGIPCLKHKCVQCCIETEMPLSALDVKRILKLGYRLNGFAARADDGWHLKNRSGRCVFLLEGGCKIYPDRPEGCRLYPLIYNENLRKAVLDNVCPFRDEFRARKDDAKALNGFLKRLEKVKRA